MNVATCGSVFSGIGLLDFGLTLAGWKHIFLCESEPERRKILSLRWPGVQIFDDVRALDGGAPRPVLFAGGFPCKGGSTAGKRTGLDHPETALWREMARVIGLLRPRLVLIENVANLLAVPTDAPGRAWGDVLGDLAALGYVCAWDCLPAAAFGAPHLRDRVFCIAANPGGAGRQERDSAEPARSQKSTAHPRPLTDAPRSSGQGAWAEWKTLGRAPSNGVALADSGGERRQQDAGGAHADEGAYGRRSAADNHESWCACPSGIPTAVEWGNYEPAIRRWEAAFGQAPAPLLRGVDAGPARRLVKSQLSALGDGVQVQAGYFLGTKLMQLAQEIGAASSHLRSQTKAA